MTSKTQYILYLIIIALLMVSGCSPAPPITNQTPSPYASASSASEDSLPVMPTATLLPGLSPPPSPEYPVLITPRVTPFPTRTRAEVREELIYMLRTNGNCLLPCFWGIEPDQTHYEELYSIIDLLGGLRFDALQANGRLRVASHFRIEEKGGVLIEFGADLQDDIVRDLKVTLTNLFDTGITPEDWSAYNMDEILRTYGVPDMVELYSGTPYNALTFAVRLKFEDNDTSIMYSGLTTETDKYLTQSSIIFCPEEIGVDAVVMWMGKHPFNEQPDGVPLSKATGLDEQAFHKLFTENPSACLALNRDAMP
jgi:hypothetical protein